MTIKQQLQKLKENWMIAVLVLLLLFFVSGNGLTSIVNQSIGSSYNKEMLAYETDSSYAGIARGYMPYMDNGFAPEVQDRKITKTASLSAEVKRGEFYAAENKLKNIITSSDSFILNENVYKSGTDIRLYLNGNYQIKVDTDKYDSVIDQLKEIGEVTSFSENAQDVTGTYTSIETELIVEKNRLKRYQEMYDDATEISDKIELNDRIFNQERTIKYYEDQIKNIDQTIDYSTLYVTITEKKSEYANVAFVKLSELAGSFVSSINNLFKLVFVLIPWAIALAIIGAIWKLSKKKK